MALPAISRAYWTSTFHCQDCKKPRPTILQSKSASPYAGQICIVCDRKKKTEKTNKSRLLESALRTKIRKQNDCSRHKTYSIPLCRARDAFYKIRTRAAQRGYKSIPTWSNIEQVTPIYEYAYKLELENPGYSFTVKHIHPLTPTNREKVCGLHTIKNLRILKRVR